MISYAVYKVVHLTGVMMVLLALGAYCLAALQNSSKNFSWKKQIAITHGVGLVLSLVGGFGLLARLGVAHGSLPGWVTVKLAIWILFGALIGILPRKPELAKPLWFLIILLGVSASYIATHKPF